MASGRLGAATLDSRRRMRALISPLWSATDTGSLRCHPSRRPSRSHPPPPLSATPAAALAPLFAPLNYERPAKLLSYVKENCGPPSLAVDTIPERRERGGESHVCVCVHGLVPPRVWGYRYEKHTAGEKEERRKSAHSFRERGPLAGNQAASNFFFAEGAVRWMSGFRGQEAGNGCSRKRAERLSWNCLAADNYTETLGFPRTYGGASPS